MPKRWLTVLAIGFLCQPSGLGQNATTGTLNGVVKASVGGPASDVAVRILQWGRDDTRRFVHLIVTDEKSVYVDAYGRFSIQLKPGDYDVLIAAPLWSPYAQKVRVEAGKETVLNAKLNLDPLANRGAPLVVTPGGR